MKFTASPDIARTCLGTSPAAPKKIAQSVQFLDNVTGVRPRPKTRPCAPVCRRTRTSANHKLILGYGSFLRQISRSPGQLLAMTFVKVLIELKFL